MPKRGDKRRSKKRKKKLARKRKIARKAQQQWIEEKRNDELVMGYEADDQADLEAERRLDMMERMERVGNRNARQRYKEHIAIPGQIDKPGHGGNTHKNKQYSRIGKWGGNTPKSKTRKSKSRSPLKTTVKCSAFNTEKGDHKKMLEKEEKKRKKRRERDRLRRMTKRVVCEVKTRFSKKTPSPYDFEKEMKEWLEREERKRRRRRTRGRKGGRRRKKRGSRKKRRRTRRKRGGAPPFWLDGVNRDYIWNDTNKRSDWYVLPKKKNNIKGARKGAAYPHFHGGKNWINFSFGASERVVLKTEKTGVSASKIDELEKRLTGAFGTPGAQVEWKKIIATLKSMLSSSSGRRSPSSPSGAASSRPKVRVSGKGKGKSHGHETWAEALGRLRRERERRERSLSPSSPPALSFVEQQLQATREDKARKEAERVALEADKRKAAAVSNDENTSGDENTDGGGVGGMTEDEMVREALRRSREDAGNPPAIQLPDDCVIPDSCDLDADFGPALAESEQHPSLEEWLFNVLGEGLWALYPGDDADRDIEDTYEKWKKAPLSERGAIINEFQKRMRVSAQRIAAWDWVWAAAQNESEQHPHLWEWLYNVLPEDLLNSECGGAAAAAAGAVDTYEKWKKAPWSERGAIINKFQKRVRGEADAARKRAQRKGD